MPIWIRGWLLVAVLFLVACAAAAPPPPQVQDTIDGLGTAGYTCDAGTNVSHSEVVTWACSREVDGGKAAVTIESAGTAVRTLAARVPRASGDEAAGELAARAFEAAGIGGVVESSILAWIRAWDGGTVTGVFGQVSLEMGTSASDVELVVELTAP